MIKALATNRIVASPAYSKILHEYNEQLSKFGRVNNKKFYEEVVSKEIPNYSLQAWYQFIKRFKTTAGLIVAEVTKQNGAVLKGESDKELLTTMLSNTEATNLGIQRALNIGTAALQKMMESPEKLTMKEAIDLLFKAMKAQDSRIHAVKSIKEDNREEEKFNRAFSDGIY